MADHSVISTEIDQAMPAPPTTAFTRRSLLGGAGLAVGTVLAASPPVLGISPAAAQHSHDTLGTATARPRR